MDESLKEVYVECVGVFGWGEVDVEYATDGDSTRVDKEGGECYTFIPLQSNAPSNLELPEMRSPFRRSSFLGPRIPPH